MAAFFRHVAKTTIDMFAIIRAERADLMIVSAFAVIIAIVADSAIVGGIKLVRPDLATALRNWRPGMRPLLEGVLCAMALLAVCLRPFWIRAWHRTRVHHKL